MHGKNSKPSRLKGCRQKYKFHRKQQDLFVVKLLLMLLVCVLL